MSGTNPNKPDVFDRLSRPQINSLVGHQVPEAMTIE
jgi:hypothetical protein